VDGNAPSVTIEKGLMSKSNKYWQDLGGLHQVEDVVNGRENEFATDLPIEQVLNDDRFSGASTGRRDFLKFLGFSVSAATLAACETPVIKSIPYVNKPEDITPGVANWYASTYYDGDDFASVLVKTREGRPIHVMGNPKLGINNGGGKGTINARINSSVLSLYDSARLTGPLVKGEASDWVTVDAAIKKGLDAAAGSGKQIVFLTETLISPSTKAALAMLQGKYSSSYTEEATSGNVKHVQLDTISYSGVAEANAESFGMRVMPAYHLHKADVIASFGADFLTSWGSSTEHSWQYAKRRKPGSMSRHWQFEARMSATGANADERVMLKPNQVGEALIALHENLSGSSSGASAEMKAATKELATELKAARGKSVVLCGSNDKNLQVVANAINDFLGNYGNTIDLKGHTNFYQGDDAAFEALVKDMSAGKVGALFIHGLNPAYSSAWAEQFKAALVNVNMSVSFGLYQDETATGCTYVCPDNHYLESWDDFNPSAGNYALAQPTIAPLFNTRQWQDSLMIWAGGSATYRQLIEKTCTTMGASWNRAVHDGGAAVAANQQMDATDAGPLVFAGNVSASIASAKKNMASGGAFEIELYTKESIGNGAHANNPWLQELPGALSKVTWDNYICMSPTDVKSLGYNMYIGQDSPATLASVTVGGMVYDLPVLPSPGQAPGSVAIALGYGRGANGEPIGKAACMMDDEGNPAPVGTNVYPMVSVKNGSSSYVAAGDIADTGKTYPLAITQTHLTDMDRHSVVKETTQEIWAKHDAPNTYNHPHELAVHEDVNGDGVVNALDKKSVTEIDLWKEHPVENVGHRWGLTIDPNACNACGACITACNSENNIPVVGKDEVRRSREMHWLRLDRYYSSDMTKHRAKEEGLGKIGMYTAMEDPSENPSVVFMPVMCQHCNHAPCETVCPVAATTHSNEGLNQMTYNRCIGTRYCANNCPYKVRRFNWWNYNTPKFGDVNPSYNELGRMVLNPDVTVRARGVIEKCSMCVQRIQAGKLEAKKAGTPVKDGVIDTACSAACGNGAIVFGDLNDKGSKVAEMEKDERAYHMLEEVGVKPNVSYMARVRNTHDHGSNHA
jgi:molybdopterin-containing oxidoreductase family iron-sulfur binding subunit